MENKITFKRDELKADDYLKSLQDSACQALMKSFGVPTSTTTAERDLNQKLADDNSEWIWVEGYKGTDKDMKCREYQYEINKQFDMPGDAVVKTCDSGFHLCKNLKSVFNFYKIEDGNRFFKVHALVRKNEYEKCTDSAYNLLGLTNDKIAARSIVFVREMTVDEILTAYGVDLEEWDADIRALAIEKNVCAAKRALKSRLLVKLGYVESLAKIIASDGDRYELALALGEQPGISMDTKIVAIFSYHD